MNFHQSAQIAEGLKQMIENYLRLAFFLAGAVFGAPHDEFMKLFPVRHGGGCRNKSLAAMRIMALVTQNHPPAFRE